MHNICFSCSSSTNFKYEASLFKQTVGIDYKKLYRLFGNIVPFNYSKFVIKNNFINWNFLIIYKDYNDHVLLKVSISSSNNYKLYFKIFSPTVSIYACDEKILNNSSNYFKKIFEDEINKYNLTIFKKELKDAGLTMKRKYTIDVVYFSNFKVYSTEQITGTFNEIFEQFTNMNDRLRYCNGSYYKFSNDKLDAAYRTFVKSFKGNYFFSCAVTRGALID